MGNLATIKIFEIIEFMKENAQKSRYLFIADEYHRIKICRFPEVYDIISIWIPFEYVVRSIVNFRDRLLILFRSEEEKNPGIYKLCSILAKDIENENFIYSELKLDEGFGGRRKEKVKMFAVNQEKQEFAFLAQYEKEEGMIIVELKIYDFENEKIRQKNSFDFENKGRVKAVKCRKEFVILAGKNLREEIISDELRSLEIKKNIKLFQNESIHFIHISLNS